MDSFTWFWIVAHFNYSTLLQQWRVIALCFKTLKDYSLIVSRWANGSIQGKKPSDIPQTEKLGFASYVVLAGIEPIEVRDHLTNCHHIPSHQPQYDVASWLLYQCRDISKMLKLCSFDLIKCHVSLLQLNFNRNRYGIVSAATWTFESRQEKKPSYHDLVSSGIWDKHQW